MEQLDVYMQESKGGTFPGAKHQNGLKMYSRPTRKLKL